MLHYTYIYTYISHGIYCSTKKEKRNKRRNHNEFKFYFQIHIDFYIGIIYSMSCLAENTRISGKIQMIRKDVLGKSRMVSKGTYCAFMCLTLQ